jgi:hypothetical protein
VLTSAPKLYYYERDTYKGEVSINGIRDVKVTDSRSFCIETSNRNWQLMADTKEVRTVDGR